MHCFRRAAFRLLSSSASAPTRSSWAVASRPSRFVFPHQQSQLLSQSRWFSDDIQKQFDGSKNAPSPDKEEVLVAESAVQSADVRSTKAEEINVDEVATPQVDGPIPEESKRTKRLRLLEKEPVAKETVFVGNLFYDVTADDLRAQMEKYGVVENVSIIFDSRGMSRGFGYVQFDTVETAKRAVEAMHLRVFEGRRVTVQFAQNNVNRTKPLQPASKTIYLGNLSFEMTDRDLNDLFKDVHNVIDVRVSVDRRTGQTRGFAHAEFIDVESARIGFETLSQKAPYGRKIRLDYSHTNRTADRVKNDKQ